jgi:hypothetical protein
VIWSTLGAALCSTCAEAFGFSSGAKKSTPH